MAETVDATKEMSKRIGGMLGDAIVLSTMYIADRLDLFKILADAGESGLSLKEIAQSPSKTHQGTMSERYLKECLSTLAAAGMLHYRAPSETEFERFILPEAYIPILADETSPKFQAGWFAMIRLIFNVADKVSDCFLKPDRDSPERGVAFSEFGKTFVSAMARAHGPGFVQVLEQDLSQAPGWLDRMNRPEGAIVADVGCGSGNVILYLAKRYPNSRFYGYDVDHDSIEEARLKLAADPSVQNVVFEVTKAEELPVSRPNELEEGSGPFDIILTVDVIHDIPHPRSALKRICEVLKDDGIYIMLEPKASSNLEENLNPDGAFLYGISLHHCMTQSLANGGEGVGAVWGKEEAERACMECGFTTFEDVAIGDSGFYLLTKSKRDAESDAQN
ncbi:hypothetical protein HDU67_007616 [Dinochytrium kinnereticum]|nr:hypothetical protein HDU67_007616 [Dinochytrium kinnereticum]